MSGNFQPKPRPVIEEPGHDLNPMAEYMIASKKDLKPHATPGGQVSGNTMPVNGQMVKVGTFAVIAKYQIGIPADHPNFPEVAKFATTFPENEYFVAWGKSGPVPWEKDESFRYIPTFSRYVVNEAGTVKNAHTGAVVYEDVFDKRAQLVADGFMNGLSWVMGNMIKILAFSKLPETFTDYTFQNYSHSIGVVDGQLGWEPKPVISARSNVDGQIVKSRTVQDFITCRIKDFTQKGEARKQIRNLSSTAAVRMGEFSVLKGDVDDVTKFGPAQESAPVPQGNASFDNDLSF